MGAARVTATVRYQADKEHTWEGVFPVEKTKVFFMCLKK